MIRLGISHNLLGALRWPYFIRTLLPYSLLGKGCRQGKLFEYFSSAENWGDLFVLKISLDHFQTGQDINRIFAAEAIKKTVNGFGAE